jgi:hypothetical protein
MLGGVLLTAVGLGPCALGATLYGAAHTGGPGAPSSLYRLCPSSGAAFLVGPIGFDAVNGLDVEPVTGVLYGVGKRPSDGEDVLITVDPRDGQGEEVGPLVNTKSFGGGGHFDLSFRDSDGTLFLLAFRQEDVQQVGLFTVNTLTGVATDVGDTTTRDPGNALGTAPDDTLFHVTKAAGGTLHTVDPGSGVSTPVLALSYSGFPTLGNPRVNTMDFEPTSETAYVGVNDGIQGEGPNYLAVLDESTGEVTHVGLSVAGLGALAWRGDAPFLFGQTIYPASSKTAFIWASPVEFEFVRGAFVTTDDIGVYSFELHAPGSGSALNDLDVPLEGEGAWYILRLACPSASWSSGGDGECPPGACVSGGRDANLP